MSDTPRTDATCGPSSLTCPTEHARTLERELTAARAQVDTLAHALAHWDDAARKAGLTYDAVRDIARDVETGNISFGRGVELLRSLARVAAEKMAKTANLAADRGGEGAGP